MEIYVARQPIFDKDMNLYGYELLYRQSDNNFYEGANENQSTLTLIANTFSIGINELIEGKKGFVNFSQDLLLREIPLLLPKEQVVIEILESIEVTEPVMDACKKLKSMGYTLALDDFNFKRDRADYKSLLEIIDIVKVEFNNNEVADQVKIIHLYKDKVTFLAEKVETWEQYTLAVKLGFSLFQGYFFSKPLLIKSKEIGFLNYNSIQIMQEFHKSEPDYYRISEIIKKDLDLSYKILKTANSIHYGSKQPVKSIKQAILRIGSKGMIRLISLMLFRDVQNIVNEQLIKTSLIRGKLLSYLAIEMNQEHLEFDYFITGLLSSIDIILNKDMKTVIDQLPLTISVKNTLLGANTDIRKCLDAILTLEQSELNTYDDYLIAKHIPRSKYTTMYLNAIKWLNSDYEEI